MKLAMGVLVTAVGAASWASLSTSVKGAYDTRKGEVIQMAAEVAFIDRVLKASTANRRGSPSIPRGRSRRHPAPTAAGR